MKALLPPACIFFIFSVSSVMPFEVRATPIGARCLVIQNGLVLLNGLCTFEKLDESGYFQIKGKNGIFVYAGGHPGGSYGFSNYYQGQKGSHAHSPMGLLFQRGACWTDRSGKNKVCSWAGK